MEQEFKWDSNPAQQERVLLWALARGGEGAALTEMDARYYDTEEGDLSDRRVALRLRSENGKRICCLKLRGAETVTESGLHTHEEYETPADNLTAGLIELSNAGAPRELIEWLSALRLTESCRTSFSRYTLQLRNAKLHAELAFDRGQLSRAGHTAPLCEIELELKSGDKETFLSLGKLLGEHFDLRTQPLSKLARALALSATDDGEKA